MRERESKLRPVAAQRAQRSPCGWVGHGERGQCRVLRTVRRGKARDNFASGGVHSLANNRPCTEMNVQFNVSSKSWHGGSGRFHKKHNCRVSAAEVFASERAINLGNLQARRRPLQFSTGWLQQQTCGRREKWVVFTQGSHEVMGIDLTQWLRGHGFAGTQPGNHIPARAQEYLLQEACIVGSILREIDVAFGSDDGSSAGAVRTARPTIGNHLYSHDSVGWAQLDSVDLSECMLRRCPC